ncbi:MAG: hypothetical protein RL481_1263 [Pseudomonadota bacterium]
MKKIVLGIATLAVATTAGAFGSAERRAKQIAAYQPVGEAVTCSDSHRIDTTRILANDIIDFKMRGGKVYRNTLPGRCSGLVMEDRFSYRTSTSRLCSVDTIRVLHNYGGRLEEGVGCGLGKFQPVEKVPELEDASYTPQEWAPFEVVEPGAKATH